MIKILAISASLSGSKSRIVLNTLKPLFSNEVDFEIFDLKEHDIQFADGRDYRDYSGSTQSLIEKIIQAKETRAYLPSWRLYNPYRFTQSGKEWRMCYQHQTTRGVCSA